MKKKLKEVAEEVEEADPELLEEIRKEETQKQ